MDPHDRQVFRASQDEKYHAGSLFWLAGSIFGCSVFTPFDSYLANYGYTTRQLLIFRLCSCAVFLGLMPLVRSAWGKRHAVAMACAVGYLPASAIVGLVVMTGGTRSIYSQTLFVVIIITSSFFPWPPRLFFAIGTAIGVTYDAWVWLADMQGDIATWLPMNGNLWTMVLLATGNTVLLERLRYREFRALRGAENAQAVAEAAHATIAKQQQELARDLEQARTFQQALLMPMPTSREAEFAVRYKPAEALGGDFYDVSVLPNGISRTVIVDVVGHGVQAALRTVVLRHEVDRLKGTCATPWEFLAQLNDAVVDGFGEGKLSYSAACVDLIRDGETCTMRVSNAGLPPVILLAQGKVEMFENEGAYQGMMRDMPYGERETSVHRGDAFILATDGLVDLIDQDSTTDGWREACRMFEGSPRGADALVAQLESMAAAAPHDPKREDDITVIAGRLT